MNVSRRKLARAFVDQIEGGTVTVSVLVRSLVAYLVEQKRVNTADLVIKDIEAEFTRRGLVLAESVTARPLDDKQRTAIKITLGGISGAKRVELTEHIDESVIGGVQLRYPGYEIDASIKKQLQQLQAK